MNEQGWPRTRDLFWLMVLCLVLAAWGFDRGRLATRLESLNPPAPHLGPGMGGMRGFGGQIMFDMSEGPADPFGPSALGGDR
jgi:hypothetical protein